jgi:hypothetical protein
MKVDALASVITPQSSKTLSQGLPVRSAAVLLAAALSSDEVMPSKRELVVNEYMLTNNRLQESNYPKSQCQFKKKFKACLRSTAIKHTSFRLLATIRESGTKIANDF